MEVDETDRDSFPMRGGGVKLASCGSTLGENELERFACSLPAFDLDDRKSLRRPMIATVYYRAPAE